MALLFNIGFRLLQTVPTFRRSLLLLTGLVWLVSLNSVAADNCLLTPLHPDLKFKEATLIIEGEVISQQSFWDPGRRNIYTSSELLIYKVFKGEARAQKLQIVTEGGVVGNDKHVFSATLQLKAGDQGIFYLQPHQMQTGLPGEAVYQVYGSLQGFITYDFASRTGITPFLIYPDLPNSIYRQLQSQAGYAFTSIRPNPALDNLKEKAGTTLRSMAPPVILSFTPEQLSAGTGSELTIRGLNFGNTRGNGSVEFQNANDGGATFIKPLDAHYIKWTDTEIIVQVPSAGISNEPAGTGTFRVTNNDPATIISPKPLQVDFAHSNFNSNNQSYSPDHINDNSQGGYTFQFETGFNSNSSAKSAFIRSLNNWTCHTTVNWIPDGITNVNATAADNINIVRFDTGNQLPAGVLGRCVSRYFSCTSGGVRTYYVTELDLEFDDATNWQFETAAPGPNQYDFETVALHELGHGLQLGHIIAPGAVMHYGIARGQQNRSLNPVSDIAGAVFVINRSFSPNACGPGPMTPRTVNNCPLPQELASFEASFVPDSGVVLLWSTFRERNIAAFHVERSPDALTWSEITSVPAIGNTTGLTRYRAIDPVPIPVIGYYRLRIRKTDGSLVYSQILEVTLQEVSFNTLEVLGNPVQNLLRVRYTSTEPTIVNLWLYDAAGRLHQTFMLELNAGSNTTILPFSSPGLGLYLLQWSDGKQTKAIRIVKTSN